MSNPKPFTREDFLFIERLTANYEARRRARPVEQVEQVEQVERSYITRIDGFLRRDSKTLAVREMKE